MTLFSNFSFLLPGDHPTILCNRCFRERIGSIHLPRDSAAADPTKLAREPFWIPQLSAIKHRGQRKARVRARRYRSWISSYRPGAIRDFPRAHVCSYSMRVCARWPYRIDIYTSERSDCRHDAIKRITILCAGRSDAERSPGMTPALFIMRSISGAGD